MVYEPFLCGDPVQAGNRGIIPAGIVFFWTVLVCTGFGKLTIPRDFTSRERKNTGKQTCPRESFGWEWEIRIFTGAIWMGMGYRDFFGNWLGGTTGTIFEKKNCGIFSRGNFPENFPGKLSISIYTWYSSPQSTNTPDVSAHTGIYIARPVKPDKSV